MERIMGGVRVILPGSGIELKIDITLKSLFDTLGPWQFL